MSELIHHLLLLAPFLLPCCFSGSESDTKENSAQTTTTTEGASSPQSVGANSPVVTGTQTNISLGNDSEVQTEDPALIEDALSVLASNIQQQNQSNTGLLQTVLSADQATTANTASGGQTNNNQTVVEVVIGIAIAFVAGIFLLRKAK